MDSQHRVPTLLSSSSSITFHDIFHELFKFSRTLGLAVSFKNSETFFVLEYFLTLNSSTDTNSGVHRKCAPFALFNYSSLSYIVIALSSAVTYLSNKTLLPMTFKDRQLNSMTFQVFHDLYEPGRKRASLQLIKDRTLGKRSDFPSERKKAFTKADDRKFRVRFATTDFWDKIVLNIEKAKPLKIFRNDPKAHLLKVTSCFVIRFMFFSLLLIKFLFIYMFTKLTTGRSVSMYVRQVIK